MNDSDKNSYNTIKYLNDTKFETHLESKGKSNLNALNGKPLSYKDELFLEFQKQCVLNSLCNLRDTGRAIIGPIGFLLGFYGVMISIALNSSIIDTNAIRLVHKLIIIIPPVLWVLALFFSLISIKPKPQQFERSLEQIEQTFNYHIHRTRIWLILALCLFFLGTSWFIFLIILIIFL